MPENPTVQITIPKTVPKINDFILVLLTDRSFKQAAQNHSGNPGIERERDGQGRKQSVQRPNSSNWTNDNYKDHQCHNQNQLVHNFLHKK